MKRKLKKMSKVVMAAVLICTNKAVCLAAESKEVKQVTDGIDVIKNLVLACVAGVGVIYLAWGLMDFGTAYSAHETTQQAQAIKKVIGGLIMIAVPAILKLLGAV